MIEAALWGWCATRCEWGPHGTRNGHIVKSHEFFGDTVPARLSLLRALTAAVAVGAWTFAVPVTGAAASPEPSPAPSVWVQSPTSQPAPVFPSPDPERPPLARPRNYDVSYPQCGGTLPGSVSAGIVGVDGGRVREANPCLADLITWATRAADPDPDYYVNTANPGPLASHFWPSAAATPKPCAADYPANDSPGCAYDYGWNSAADSWARAGAAAAQAGAGSPVASTWWLDVETGNSWESVQAGDSPTSQANNTAALQGTLDYLSAQGVQNLGVYSTRRQWSEITGGATLGGLPVWYAGTGTLDSAMTHCAPAWSFTGGPVRQVQHSLGDFDANEPC